MFCTHRASKLGLIYTNFRKRQDELLHYSIGSAIHWRQNNNGVKFASASAYEVVRPTQSAQSSIWKEGM